MNATRNDAAGLKDKRIRLSSISLLMRFLSERIAKDANKQEARPAGRAGSENEGIGRGSEERRFCNCWTGRVVRFVRASVVRCRKISNRCSSDWGSRRNSGWIAWRTSANGSVRAWVDQDPWKRLLNPEATTEPSVSLLPAEPSLRADFFVLSAISVLCRSIS